MINAKNITVIPATINPITKLPTTAVQLRRVAGYARVSTDSEEQLLQQKERRQIQAESVGNCLKALEELDLLQIAFTDGLWNTVVDRVTVYADKRLVFHFRNGVEQEVKVCK